MKTADIAAYWDEVFAQEKACRVTDPSCGHAGLDRALTWLCTPGGSLLDFGCGNGVLLLKCALRGMKLVLGIDASPVAARLAGDFLVENDVEGKVLCGDTAALEALPPGAWDAAILSNILDNLPPEESLRALHAVHRALRPGGRVLLKLNAYLTAEQREAWGVRIIAGDLLDDGLLLWNLTSDCWAEMLDPLFAIEAFETIEYPEHEQTNRLFRLIKREEAHANP
ncbi:MAG: class I SAM-dependent methyltransferase [Oscillospiraceae bacterium]|jgi:SAM-dependent methyltransferase|nr:class I SAM-dependent methyltransferase [Oscillospiraceae bacterium]